VLLDTTLRMVPLVKGSSVLVGVPESPEVPLSFWLACGFAALSIVLLLGLCVFYYLWNTQNEYGAKLYGAVAQHRRDRLLSESYDESDDLLYESAGLPTLCWSPEKEREEPHDDPSGAF
jgi:hypothetical protein